MKKLIALFTALLFSCSAAFAQQYTAPIGTTSVQISGANTTSAGALQVESPKMFGTPSISEYGAPLLQAFSFSAGQVNTREIVQHTDGNIYGLIAPAGSVFKMTAAGVFTEYQNAGSTFTAICSGSDGYLYLTDTGNNAVVQMDVSGNFVSYPIPTASSNPVALCYGSDGNVYGTENSGNKVFQMASGGGFTEYAIPTASSGPAGICQGTDGNLYGVENAGNKLFKMTPAGAFTEYSIPTAAAGATGICAGNDQCFYFTESSGNNVGKLTFSGKDGSASVAEYAIPTAIAKPSDICQGADGRVYGCEFEQRTGPTTWGYGTNIFAMTPSGVFTEYAIANAQGGPFSLCQANDGNLYGLTAINNSVFVKSVQSAWVSLTQNGAPLAQANALPVKVAAQDKATYAASVATSYGIGTSTTDAFTVTGSSSKTVKINRIVLYLQASAVTGLNVSLVKRSAADTGGIVSFATAVPLDSTSSAATASCAYYTGAPTLGTAVGSILTTRLVATTSSFQLGPVVLFDAQDYGQPITLHGTGEQLAINLSNIGGAVSSFLPTVFWTEE